MSRARLEDRLAGCLLGVAVGDALGLPGEGLSAATIARRFGRLDRYRLLGGTGYVSDDTELSALLAECLCHEPLDPAGCARRFRRAVAGFVLRLPFGLGMATLRAGLRAAVGVREPGVRSAGNGAAMRAGVLGVFFQDEPTRRLAFGRALAEVTHRDARAVEGALYVAEVAARAAAGEAEPCALVDEAREVVAEPALRAALVRAAELAAAGAGVEAALGEIGASGFVLHSVPFAAYVFARWGSTPRQALVEVASAGGDADTNAAIVGGWLGARHGREGLPAELVGSLEEGPFGATRLRALARALSAAACGQPAPVPRFSLTRALGRNLALHPVILAHGFRRLLYWL